MAISTIQLSDTFDQWRLRTNDTINRVNAQLDPTVLANLQTSNTGTLVDAINEHEQDIISANTRIGDVNSLTTTAKSNLVAAVNEVLSEVGDIATLTTTANTSVVDAVNELDSDLADLTATVGDTTTLITSDKTSVVAAINETRRKATALSVAL